MLVSLSKLLRRWLPDDATFSAVDISRWQRDAGRNTSTVAMTIASSADRRSAWTAEVSALYGNYFA